ncbi:MAG: hypothetical protein HZC24_15130 [Rhodocyclales bacterium]|nr:hypothetical protein [Rhodocyclales bacterium]
MSNERSEKALIAAGVRFTPDKRANGQAYLRVSSEKPLKEQFIDMFVEVRWTAGRRVHEYSFLLEAADVFQKPGSVPIAAEVSKDAAIPVAPTKAVEQGPAPQKAPALPAPRPETKPAKPAAEVSLDKVPEKPIVPVVEAGTTRLVVAGDTLGKIARETKAESVTLVQMLVALLRDNRHAFVDDNMNRLRTGKLLRIPNKEVAEAVDKREAYDIFVAQSIEFDAYRKKLADLAAAGPGRAEQAPQQGANGRITLQGEGKAPPTAVGRDKLEISRSEAGGKAGKGGAGAPVDDQIAMERALKEANSRISDLERNLADLKRLAELNRALIAKNGDLMPAAGAPADATLPPVAAAPMAVPVKPAGLPAARPAPPPPPSFLEGNLALIAGAAVLVLLLVAYRIVEQKRAAAGRGPDRHDR